MAPNTVGKALAWQSGPGQEDVVRNGVGVLIPDGTVLWPEPEAVLVGRNGRKLADIAGRHGLSGWTTDLPAALARAVRWEKFPRHVVADEPFPWDLHAAASGVQLAELSLRAATEGRRIEIPESAYFTTAGVPQE